MQKITKCLVLLALCLVAQLINAQDTISNANNRQKIEEFKKAKIDIQNEERQFLKVEVESINTRLEKGGD